MALEDKDFIARQIDTAAKGLAKVIDMDVLEKLFSKENVDRLHEIDEKRENNDESNA